jgi:hypothetical protein
VSKNFSVVKGKRGVFPHKKFILYLLSKKMTPFEIAAFCHDRAMLAPSDDDLQDISAELGEIPAHWQSTTRGAKPQFRNWLGRKKLLDAWRQTDFFIEASAFLYKVSARKDFEALYLIRGDIVQAREELLIKYPPAFVPAVEALNLYVDYYWDLGALKYNEIVDYLEEYQAGKDLLPAVDGDLTTTYARLGLRQKIEEEEFYDNLIALANQQIQRLRKSDELNGSMLMGIAALSRQASDAILNRKELHASSTPTVDVIRQQATDFFRVKMARQDEIVSIDDLNTIIDIEEDEHDNVRKLEARG